MTFDLLTQLRKRLQKEEKHVVADGLSLAACFKAEQYLTRLSFITGEVSVSLGHADEHFAASSLLY